MAIHDQCGDLCALADVKHTVSQGFQTEQGVAARRRSIANKTYVQSFTQLGAALPDDVV